ncbi:hypothetical protein WBG99_15085 [Streptomyces sp. TG1A-60]|uniref:hypothetical protein n=1 Tax=Streptomyces sp. TG1A-60 TaxID=3129111 RepID=UPI0030D4D201
MTDPGLVATTIALGDSDQPLPAPHGANTVMPAQVFVTVHGTTADVVGAADGRELGSAPVTVDKERRQVEVPVKVTLAGCGSRTFGGGRPPSAPCWGPCFRKAVRP